MARQWHAQAAGDHPLEMPLFEPTELDEELEVLDPPDALLSDALYLVAAGADGLPDPLAEIAEMLPGGRATRGRPPIAFVQTRLDQKLAPSLRERPPTLVVLSGNAGDGKTTFLAELITSSGGTYEPGVRNEYDVDLAPGRPYRVVLDGSEDAENRTNDALLEEALAPFQGPSAIDEVERGTLIAINKGRLLRFLQARPARYGFLWDLVKSAFLGEGEPRSSPYVLIDLNDRTFVGPDFGSSLMVQVMERLAKWPGWQGCDSCPANLVCPALANVRLMGSSAGQVDGPGYRLWRVFAAADLDDRVHITARHVVSQLARLIGGGRRCPDIRLEAANEGTFSAPNYIFNAAFDPKGSRALGDSSALDEVLATYDPSERDNSITGRKLHAAVAVQELDTVLPGGHEAFFEVEAGQLAEVRIDEEPPRGTPDYRERTIALAHSIERKLYLGGVGGLVPSFSLDTMDGFLDVALSPSPGTTLPQLVENLNAALGVEASTLPDLLSPRDYARGLRGRGFAMLIPISSLTVEPGTALGVPYAANEYLEGWPRSLLLRAVDLQDPEGPRTVATLSIPLLLYEILGRSGRGFRPASQTERAYMVRLRGFYRQLSEHRWAKQPQYVLYDNGRIVGKAKIDGNEYSLMGL